MSTPYLNLAAFTDLTVMPNADVSYVETKNPGFIAAQISIQQSRLDSRLRKRYAVPFVAPVPPVVLGWLSKLVTPDVYRKRGVNPSDPQLELVEKDRTTAEAEIKEAADSKDGLFDLPLNETATPVASAIAAGGPLGCSQTSPYDWVDVEAEALNGR